MLPIGRASLSRPLWGRERTSPSIILVDKKFHELRTDDTKKSMHGLIYIFWHVFILNHINNKFQKYRDIVNIQWCSKLYFSPISYICPYKFLSLYLPYLWRNEWKIKNLHGQNYSFYQYKQDFNCYFHDFGKKFVSSVLNCIHKHAKNFRVILTYRHKEWRGARSQEGRPSADRWDYSRLPSRFSRGGLLRQPCVSRPGRVPFEIWQFLLLVAIKDTILPSVLQQIIYIFVLGNF
jgi:hypothetical protein